MEKTTKKTLKSNVTNIMKRQDPNKVKTDSFTNDYSNSLLFFRQCYHSGVVVLVHNGLVLQVNTEFIVDITAPVIKVQFAARIARIEDKNFFYLHSLSRKVVYQPPKFSYLFCLVAKITISLLKFLTLFAFIYQSEIAVSSNDK